MARSLGLAVVLGTALCAAQSIPPVASGFAPIIKPGPGNGEIILGPPGRPGFAGLYSLTHSSGNAIQFDTGSLPIRNLATNDIRPVANPLDPDNMVCCPPGTIFNGESCVFLASQVCPRDFFLDPETKSVCISTTPPCEGDLHFEDGLCVSPDKPHCADATAVFDETTMECVSTGPPVCDAPFERVGPDCVSPNPPTCHPGFEPRGGRCVSRAGPTCNSANLVVETKTTDDRTRLICVSKDLPQCPDGNAPVEGLCLTKKPPHCDDGFEPEGGDCRSTQPPCPPPSVYTVFPDNSDAVCSTVEPPVCDFGAEPQGGQCVSQRGPCEDGYTFDAKTGLCKHEEDVVCEPGKAPFKTTSGYSDAHVVCCPNIAGMKVDEYDRCSIQVPPHGDCPEDMDVDPDNDDLCIAPPTDANCARGKYDPRSGLCVEVTDQKCVVGQPDGKGQCVLKKTCTDPDAEWDEKSDLCVLKKKPECPKGTAVQIGSKCFAEKRSTCPDGTTHSADGKSCIYNTPPKCTDPDTKYDPKRQLCVHTRKVDCLDGTGHLEGTDCVSSGLPQCVGSDVVFDVGTGKCVSTKPAQCEPGFHVNPADGTKCIGEPPHCTGEGFKLIDGKCVSNKAPECPAHSKWINSKKACVSDSGPCAEGTPDLNGNCIAKEPPHCKDPETTFTPGVGCVALDDKPKCTHPGTTLNPATGECEAEHGPDCTLLGPNLELRGGQCVSTRKPHCADGTEPTEDGRCVARGKPVCDGAGRTLDDTHKVCVGAPPRCADGSVLDESKTKCVTASSRTCFVLLSCPDVEDDGPMAIGG